MKLAGTAIDGVWRIDLEPRGDERGTFARAFCRRELAEHGVGFDVQQMNLATTRRRGTFRGFHYQAAPSNEAKLIRCTRGAVFDAAVDVRPGSPTFGRCVGLELSAENRAALLVAARVAHGYLALTDDAEVLYAAADAYAPELERGLRYDDPIVAMAWPIEIAVVSDKDRSWPDFTPAPVSAPGGAA